MKDLNSAVVVSKVSTELITKETIIFNPDLIVSPARTQNTNFAYFV